MTVIHVLLVVCVWGVVGSTDHVHCDGGDGWAGMSLTSSQIVCTDADGETVSGIATINTHTGNTRHYDLSNNAVLQCDYLVMYPKNTTKAILVQNNDQTKELPNVKPVTLPPASTSDASSGGIIILLLPLYFVLVVLLVCGYKVGRDFYVKWCRPRDENDAFVEL